MFPNPSPDAWTFQSTLSVRRATRSPRSSVKSLLFQSTLSVRRATHDLLDIGHETGISIHALRKESDLPSTVPSYWVLRFQSTLSVRRATRHRRDSRRIPDISIHALRKESDRRRLHL